MSPTKASKLLGDYAKNNYNAYKTLIENGYSEKTARKNAGRTIQTANDVVKSSLEIQTDSKEETAKSVLDIVGITREEVLNQLKTIALNERDYTSAIKVLSVFSKELGVQLDDTEQNKAPSVNITVEKVEANTPHPEDTAMLSDDSV